MDLDRCVWLAQDVSGRALPELCRPSGLHRPCPLEGPNPKNGKVMVLGRRETYVKNVGKKWSPPKGSRPKKKCKLSKISFWGPLRGRRGVFWIVLSFFLGWHCVGGDHFVDHFFTICVAPAQNHFFTIFWMWAFQGTWPI